MLSLIILFVFGGFVGFCSGFFGIGGGSIIVAVLIYFGYDVKEAIGVSVVQMVFSSVFGSYINYKKGVLKFGDSIFVGFGGLLGGFLSGPVISAVPSLYLLYLFAFLLVIMIVRGFLKVSFVSREIKPPQIVLVLIGAACGVLGISVGIGGGMLISLVFFGFLGYDIKKAISMGLFFVLFTSVGALISQSIGGNINYQLGVILGVGSLVGVYFGTLVGIGMAKEKQNKFNIAFNVIVLVATIVKIVTY